METKEFTKEEQNLTLLGGTSFMLLANDVFCGKILDYYSHIKKQPKIYRHEIKRNVNQLKLTCDIYASNIRRCVNYRYDLEESLADAAQRMEDAITNEMFLLNNSVFNEISKKMKNRTSEEISIVAHTITIDMLSRIIKDIYGKIEVIAREERKSIQVLSPHHIRFCVNRVSESIFKHFNLSKDFTLNSDIANGLVIVIRKMLNENMIK